MAINMNRKRLSWFAPQFTSNNYAMPSNAPPVGLPQRKIAQRRHLPLGKLPMPEPLFHESYLVSEEDLSPTTPDPNFHARWIADYHNDYFGSHDETLEDLGLIVDDDECSIVAKFISITYAGKPKVVDIPPPAPPSCPPSREESPRRKAEVVTRPPIVWRMPSYDGSSCRSSQSTYTLSDRSESFCSTSTATSSISDECKTPDLIPSDMSKFLEPQSRPTTPSRANTLRRHSRNLSASFSKAFLNRLKDIEPTSLTPTTTVTPAPDVPPMPACFLQSNTYDQLPRGALPRTNTLEPPMSKHDMYLSPPMSTLSHAPALRRKRSIASILF